MSHDAEIAAAKAQARRAKIMSYIWWAQVPIISAGYWFVSSEPVIEKLLLVYLADVSIIANAVTYAGKAQAAEAKQAGYENPSE